MTEMQTLLDGFRSNRKNGDEMLVAALNTVNRAVKSIFDAKPNARVIVVQGFTPHFNDGDVCEFGMTAAVNFSGLQDIYYAGVEDAIYDLENDVALSDVDSDLLREIAGDTTDAQQVVADYNSAYNNKEFDDAIELLNYLHNEFKVLDRNNGTFWIFTRDSNAENGFTMREETFEHD